jgi:hydroxymethylbilane synthase
MSAAMPLLRVGTRGSPLALIQTRSFINLLRGHHASEVQEHVIRTTGDVVQDRRLALVGGKGLFAKEIHDALSQGRIDCAAHSLKDLETSLPPGIVLGCTLKREDPRDALILADARAMVDARNPFTCLPMGAVVGTSSVRRQAQLLHARPDLAITTLRGNVQTRLAKLEQGACAASLLALAGLKRLGLADRANAVLDPDVMVPAAGQGIIGVTVRQDDATLRALLVGIEDRAARAIATAERAMLLRLDGSCRTPIAAYAELVPDGRLHLTGLVARADGSFLLKRRLQGLAADAERIGHELGDSLRADCPRDIFD